jgi:hypothetical protein
MATDYRKTKSPVRPWRPRDHARFAHIIAGLRWESYPNGNAGWEDRAAHRFEAAGFRVKKNDRGDPANIAIVTLDISE